MSLHYNAICRHEVTILYRNTALDLHQLPSRELVKLDDALSELAEIYSRSQLYSPAIPGSGASTPRAVASAIR
jgi:hypothetical protein